MSPRTATQFLSGGLPLNSWWCQRSGFLCVSDLLNQRASLLMDSCELKISIQRLRWEPSSLFFFSCSLEKDGCNDLHVNYFDIWGLWLIFLQSRCCCGDPWEGNFKVIKSLFKPPIAINLCFAIRGQRQTHLQLNSCSCSFDCFIPAMKRVFLADIVPTIITNEVSDLKLNKNNKTMANILDFNTLNCQEGEIWKERYA